MAHDFALRAYINQIKYPEIVIFHRNFLKDNAFLPLIAIKTISRYLGVFHVRWNDNKIILLEHQVAIVTYGEGPTIYLVRSKYYLACTTYGLACGIKDLDLLSD